MEGLRRLAVAIRETALFTTLDQRFAISHGKSGSTSTVREQLYLVGRKVAHIVSPLTKLAMNSAWLL